MNYTVIEQLFRDSESSVKQKYDRKKKPINGDKRRRCEKYIRQHAEYTRRKQQKINYDTWRREELMNEKDEKLQTLYYANFLGDKDVKSIASYNSCNVNLKLCDIMCLDENTSDDDCCIITIEDDISELSFGSSSFDDNQDENQDELERNLDWVYKLAERIYKQQITNIKKIFSYKNSDYDEEDVIDWNYPIEYQENNNDNV
jgi:hypothetical protein